MYAAWLVERGYSVHLVNAVPRHVEQARAALSRFDAGRWSAEVGDARALEAEAESADALLLCGPLYHLTDAGDRALALAEAFRVLRPGGVLFAAAISRFASALDGIARGLLADPLFRDIVGADLESGQHRNPTDNPSYFATAYFHRPEELDAEVAGAGFGVLELSGLEGPTWLLPDIGKRWSDPAERARLSELLERLGHEPTLVGASAHLLAVARRP